MTKAERTRQFIIEQSAPLFNTKGVAGTAMSDIMEATKMDAADMEITDGAKTSVALALIGEDGPTGRFIHLGEESPW